MSINNKYRLNSENKAQYTVLLESIWFASPEYSKLNSSMFSKQRMASHPVICSAKALIVLAQHLPNIYPCGLVNLNGLVKLHSHADQIGAATFWVVLAVLCNINQTVSEWCSGRKCLKCLKLELNGKLTSNSSNKLSNIVLYRSNFSQQPLESSQSFQILHVRPESFIDELEF